MPELTVEDRHHLDRVRRLRAGDPVSVTDGRGAWRWCRFGPELLIDGEIQCVDVPNPPVTVAFALVKGERPELVVQKLTELGVDRVVPFVAERSVVRWDAEKTARSLTRLRRVAIEAAMQSRRVWLPTIDDLRTFDEVLTLPGMVAADRGGTPPSLTAPSIMIGPEGGWSDQERSRLGGLVSLGGGVLRAETAAITAGAMLCALRDGLVAHPGPEVP
ncbi:MAG: 16S rRNA (uracil(1498)-N(3))-methyltransferase [Actinobacteria bacterium]|nr:16S rRNA (uracil(1498)-N(3))-methyltransferase [Actinomycetota bacterium]